MNKLEIEITFSGSFTQQKLLEAVFFCDTCEHPIRLYQIKKQLVKSFSEQTKVFVTLLRVIQKR